MLIKTQCKHPKVSNSGAWFYAGKGIKNTGAEKKNTCEGSILGAIAAALHTRTMAKFYGVRIHNLMHFRNRSQFTTITKL